MTVYVGTSGWSYDDWIGVLYPDGTPVAKRLGAYIQRYDTVELNSSYYHWPAQRTFAGWQARLPEGFLMSVKAPRELTHYKRLDGSEDWLERIAAGMTALAQKRGLLLVQLSPNFARDDRRLAYFLTHLPDWLQTAIEFRHPSWHEEAVFELLEQNRVAYCVMSGAQLPCILRVTAPIAYVRLHGPDADQLYTGSYPDEDLHWWRDRINEWTAMGRDVFVYFNNTIAGCAIRNADTLKGLLGR